MAVSPPGSSTGDAHPADPISDEQHPRPAGTRRRGASSFRDHWAASGAQVVGEVSALAEGAGVAPGMTIAEALARAPTLRIVPPDPVGVADTWATLLERLESIGAEVDSEVAGVAAFDGRALARLHGRVHASVDDVVEATRRALRTPARIGAGPTLFCALVGATLARTRRAHVVDGAEGLREQPVGLLRHRAEVEHLVEPLERLGIGTLGQLAALPADAIADRFGRPGTTARNLARGGDRALRPRSPVLDVVEEIELAEVASGAQLQAALRVLIDRLLLDPGRCGRGVRVVTLSARLVEAGTWQQRVVLRQPVSDGDRLELVLAARLATLPTPAETLRLSVEKWGPLHDPTLPLWVGAGDRRDEQLREAIEQIRAVAGAHGALRIRPVEPDSRIPERRMTLTPFERRLTGPPQQSLYARAITARSAGSVKSPSRGAVADGSGSPSRAAAHPASAAA